MSAKNFLIAHGEKLAVAVVAGGCALVINGAVGDPTIQPKQNQKQIEEINEKIDRVLGDRKNQPTMKEPPAYVSELSARLAETAPSAPTMAWLTQPPDKGRSSDVGDGTYLYVFELLQPEVELKDAVGSLQVSLRAAKPTQQSSSRRVSAEADRTWSRRDKKEITNRARHLGVQLEIRIGDGEWKPFALPGAKDGFIPLSMLDKSPVSVPTPEPWQRHQIRARYVAGATAFDLDGARVERPEQTVLVHAGPLSGGPAEDQALVDQATAEAQKKDGKLFSAFLRPSEPPAGVRLAANEKAFLGPWSPVATVQATASVRFALLGLSTEPLKDDPTKTRDVGRFLLLRLFQQGDDRKWMDKPLEARFGVGDKLGVPEARITNPFTGKTIEIEVDTPFVIEKLVKDQPRVLYWLVKPVPRQGGGRDRDLALEKKDANTDIVVLRNPETGTELTLTRLITINPPTNPTWQIYPHRPAAYVERDDFLGAPSEFRQWGLSPEAPKSFPPGKGPLAALSAAKKAEGALDAENYNTDTAYFAFPDARLMWWDTVEHGVKVHDPEGVLKAKAPAQPAPVEAAPVAPQAQPAPGTDAGPKPPPGR
jgi:hypothetical protein